MSMGYMANYADTVSEDFVKKICGKKYDAFMDEYNRLLMDDESDFDPRLYFSFEEYLNDIANPDSEFHKISKIFTDMQFLFDEKTGLTLNLGYHDVDDDGDTYDEVNGLFWHVGGVYQYTPSGEKFKDEIQRKFFVVFG